MKKNRERGIIVNTVEMGTHRGEVHTASTLTGTTAIGFIKPIGFSKKI